MDHHSHRNHSVSVYFVGFSLFNPVRKKTSEKIHVGWVIEGEINMKINARHANGLMRTMIRLNFMKM